MTEHPELQKFPKALRPSLQVSGANRPIRLYSGQITFVQPADTHEADAKIEFAWIPSPRIRFRSAVIPVTAKYAYTSCIGPVELHLNDGRVIDKAEMTLIDPATLTPANRTFRARLGGRIHEAPIPRVDAKVSYVEFLVPQLKTHKGWQIRYGQGLSCSRHALTAGDWKITLDELKNCDETWKALEKNSGFGVTHVGRLERLDNAPFGPEATRHGLRGLGWYLSFASGRWTGPILPRGIETGDKLLWDLWDAWRIVPYVERESWIHPHATEQFEMPFTGFFDHWEDPNLTDVIEIAIHWYIEANAQAGSIEGSIILMQAAFELLASALPVHQHAGLSKSKFDDVPAGIRTRHLFDWAGISTLLPGEFKDLAAMVKPAAKADAPSAMAAIRNTITHPTPKNRKSFSRHTDQARYEAWIMGLWYLELCLLRVFEYQGKYRNRCSAKVELVPWAGSPPKGKGGP